MFWWWKSNPYEKDLQNKNAKTCLQNLVIDSYTSRAGFTFIWDYTLPFLINEYSVSLKYTNDLDYAAIWLPRRPWMYGLRYSYEDMFWPFIISVKSGLMNEAWFLSESDFSYDKSLSLTHYEVCTFYSFLPTSKSLQGLVYPYKRWPQHHISIRTLSQWTILVILCP